MLNSVFEQRYGVSYLAQLQDGEDFSGRARRVAKRLALERERQDEELFATHGGREQVHRRLLAHLADSRFDLLELDPAEERLMLMISVDTARTAPVSVEKIDAVVGFGVFAAQTIRAGEVIGEYTGILRKFRDEDVDNHYLAQVPAYGRYTGFVIDGRDQGNVTRFINHSVRADNVSNEFVFHAKRWHRILRADRAIQPGEQILWDYGEDYWRARESPLDL